MKKILAILLTFFCTTPLLAEKIGGLEIDFPPSVYEWRLLIEESPFYEEDNDTFKIYTHREADALEVLFAGVCKLDEDDEDEMDTAESLQNEINSYLEEIFPNHRIHICNFFETETEGFFEWEFNDGLQQILHGYTRSLQTNEGKDGFLCYFTTALKTEPNRVLWTNVLMNAK